MSVVVPRDAHRDNFRRSDRTRNHLLRINFDDPVQGYIATLNGFLLLQYTLLVLCRLRNMLILRSVRHQTHNRTQLSVLLAHIFIRTYPSRRVGSFAHPDAAKFAHEESIMARSGPTYQNRVLASLPSEEIKRLQPHLSPVDLKQGQVLLDGTAPYGYFLETGIASVVVTTADGHTVEVGIIGVDGVVGIPILLDAGQSPGSTFVQIAGSGYRIRAATLKAEFERSGELRRHLHRYMQGFMVQSAQTAACNRLHNIEERLSRWLMGCRDRLETDQLRLTQDFLGQMLGAPRTTVTLAAGMLQRAGLINHARGVVTILDRKKLEATACECYGIVRDEFQRLELL